jgi:hypothetical protein
MPFSPKKVINMALLVTLFGYIRKISYLYGGALYKKKAKRRIVQGKYTKFGRHNC